LQEAGGDCGRSGHVFVSPDRAGGLSCHARERRRDEIAGDYDLSGDSEAERLSRSICWSTPSIHWLSDSGMIHGHAKLVSVAIQAPFMAPEKSPSSPFERSPSMMPMLTQKPNQQPTTRKTRRIKRKISFAE
jgi:hypothetical protein